MVVVLKGSVLILVFVIDGGGSDDVLIFGMLVKMINIRWRIEYASIRICSGLWWWKRRESVFVLVRDGGGGDSKIYGED